jgi:hypothetical protein
VSAPREKEIVFHRGYTAEIMKKKLKNVSTCNGLETDLHVAGPVFDLELEQQTEIINEDKA